MKDTYVVIPALEPSQKFYDYLRELTAMGSIPSRTSKGW